MDIEIDDDQISDKTAELGNQGDIIIIMGDLNVIIGELTDFIPNEEFIDVDFYSNETISTNDVTKNGMF